MLKDANNANSMHNSYTGRATTASIIYYCLPRRSVCVSLTHIVLTPEQLTVKLCFGLVHAECMTVSLCTSILRFNAHKGSLSDADHSLHCIRCTDVYNVCDGLQSYPPVA